MKDLLKSFEKGIGFGLGLLVLAVLSLGVYAFVEPTSGPSVDMYINPNSSANSQSSFVGDNRVPTGSFPDDYIEVCFKEGTTSYDSNSGGTSTTGGNCDPGDLGFVIEQESTETEHSFAEAVEICLQKGMRLHTVFEYQLSCENRAAWGFNATETVSFADSKQWVDTASSNVVFTTSGTITAYLTVGYRASNGAGACEYGGSEYALHTQTAQAEQKVRCAK